MWIKFSTETEALECAAKMQSAVDSEHRPGPKEIILAVRTYDGMWAVPKLATIAHAGIEVDSIEPPVVEGE